MENVVHQLTLDLTGPDMLPRVEVQQDNARSLCISLTQGGRPYWIAEGVTAVFSGRKPDGIPLFNACTIEKNRVRYDFTAQTTNVAGIVECEILLYSGDERILASPRFELAIDELIHRDGDVPESAPEISALTQMVAASTAMIEDLREALGELVTLDEVAARAEAAADAAALSQHNAARIEDNVSGLEVNAELNAQRAQAAAGEARDAAQNAGNYAGAAQQAWQQSNHYAGEAAASAQNARKCLDDTELAAEAAAAAAERAEAVVDQVPEWARQPQKPAYTAQEVGAEPAGKAAEVVDSHETNLAAHADIRNTLEALRNRVNAALNSDDIDLDQLKEIVAYIKSNRTLIDDITTNKVSVSDIVDDLDTWETRKPLSAAAGYRLNASLKTLRSDLPEAINDALTLAKESGAFDGPQGPPGDDYVLTDDDMQEIAQKTVALLPRYDGGVRDG